VSKFLMKSSVALLLVLVLGPAGSHKSSTNDAQQVRNVKIAQWGQSPISAKIRNRSAASSSGLALRVMRQFDSIVRLRRTEGASA
jgi:hypothetical protein